LRQLQRRKQQLGIQQAGGLSVHLMKTKAAQNFQMAGGIKFPNALKNLAQNKAVSVKNSAP
jgi:hypothetical protein